MLEPAITLRTGWRYFKAQFQASYAKYLNNLDDNVEFYDFTEGPHISCGLYLTLSNRWNKEKQINSDVFLYVARVGVTS